VSEPRAVATGSRRNLSLEDFQAYRMIRSLPLAVLTRSQKHQRHEFADSDGRLHAGSSTTCILCRRSAALNILLTTTQSSQSLALGLTIAAPALFPLRGLTRRRQSLQSQLVIIESQRETPSSAGRHLPATSLAPGRADYLSLFPAVSFT
jgi:hypothetical protein